MTKQRRKQGLTLKHRASEFAHFAGQGWSGELHDASIDGNAAAKSGETADNPVSTDHRGFDYFSRGQTHYKGDNRASWKVDVRNLFPGLKYNLRMIEVDGLQVWPKRGGVTLGKRGQ
jgi:hypothetical protein